jgi:hypothetical protein
MKKLIAFLFVCGFAVAVVSCGQKAENDTAADTTVTVTEPAPVVADTTTDSTTVAPVDTTAAH